MNSLLKNEKSIFDIARDQDFEEACLSVFRSQYKNNAVYRQWTDLLRIRPENVEHPSQIPFLPVEFFKNHKVVSTAVNQDTLVFTSSATTSQIPAKHYVPRPDLYRESFLRSFALFYGDISNYCLLALLPNYLEREGSSLVYMCRELIQLSGHPQSGFYLRDTQRLIQTIDSLKGSGQKVLLIGVSYALMDLCDHGLKLDENFIVMETGGMKGTRKEMLKPELHDFLKKGLGLSCIHSEYGMTELLSQAYSTGNGLFSAPPWMRFYTREVDDPLKIRQDDKTGGINVIDLANLYSCAFIATKDLGRLHAGNALELMGRYDHSDVRGCNLMFGNF